MTFQGQGKKVIQIELEALQSLLTQIDDSFDSACELLINCKGRIIILGMGKSGHIGSKIAATLASTGSPAFFVHPAEASHGDLGMIREDDIAIILSYSGTTAEILPLLPILQHKNIPVISICGKSHSPIAKASTINLNVAISQEACPHNLAPTASTTAMLALGDAIAIALLHKRNFSAEDFARSHPAGNLGKRVLMKVKDLMRTGDDLPTISPSCTLQQAILEVTKKRLGLTLILDKDRKLCGIFTDGDLRRAFEHNLAIKDTPIAEVMSKIPKTISTDELAVSALEIMEKFKITSLVVTDDDQKVVGLIHMHAIIEAGIV